MGVIDTAKAALKIANTIENVELLKSLSTLQGEVFDLESENRGLRDTVQELKDTLQLKNDLQFQNNFYWIGVGNEKQGPFCTKCFDSDSKTTRMLSINNGQHFGCPICNLVLQHNGDPGDVRVINRFLRTCGRGWK